MYRKVEVGHLSDEGGGEFIPYPVGGTASVVHKGEPKKSVYLTFDPGGMSKTNWRTT